MDGSDTFGWCLRVLITDILLLLTWYTQIMQVYICLSLIGLQCLLSLVDITSFCFFLIAWQLKWQVYSGSCLFFPFCYPKKYDAMSLGSHERARYRSICYLWFRWSLFGVDWSIIQKLTVLHMNMDCFSCSQPLLLYLFIYLFSYLFIYLFIYL